MVISLDLKVLSYFRLRELVLEAFIDIVSDISAIGTHSLRSGKATAAADTGVPDRLFNRLRTDMCFSLV